MNKILEHLKRKEIELKRIEELYKMKTEREKAILRSGWAACETRIGLEHLEETSQNETTS